MTPLGAAVIGCGVIGPAHAASFAGIPGVQLRYVCDVQPQRAQRLAGEFNTQPLTDYRQALTDPQVQLISLATPHPVHPMIFADALAAGKAVISEKPLASNWTDIDHMVRLAAAAPTISSGVFQHRYSPIIRRLHQFITQGDLGRIVRGKVWFRCFRGTNYYQADAWRGKAVEEGGGVLINQAIHFIDLLTHFLGEPTGVRGRVEHRWVPDIEVEDRGTAQVTYRSLVGHEPIPGELDIANQPEEKWEAAITVEGDKASFTIGAHHRPTSVHGFSSAMQAALAESIRLEDTLPTIPGKPEYGPWHYLQFKDFVDAYQSKRQPMVTVADAAHSNRLVLGVYASSQRDGQVIDLTRPYRDPYRFVPLAIRSNAMV